MLSIYSRIAIRLIGKGCTRYTEPNGKVLQPASVNVIIRFISIAGMQKSTGPRRGFLRATYAYSKRSLKCTTRKLNTLTIINLRSENFNNGTPCLVLPRSHLHCSRWAWNCGRSLTSYYFGKIPQTHGTSQRPSLLVTQRND